MHGAIDQTFITATTDLTAAIQVQAKNYTRSILSNLFLMKLFNHLSGNTILNTFYKFKEKEMLYYFSAYQIPDAYYAPANNGISEHIFFALIAKHTNISNLIESSLNFDVIAVELGQNS